MVLIPRIWHQTRSRLSLYRHCWLFLGLLIPTSTTAADSRPSPQRHIPANNLVAYFQFDGLDAHALAWKGTAAHAALVKTKAGAMISELARQVGEWLLKQDTPLVTGGDVIALHEHLIRHGFVFAVYSHGNDVYSIMFVLNDFGNEKLRPSLAHWKQYFEPFGRPVKIRNRGRDTYVFDDRPELGEWEPALDPFPLPLIKTPANVRVGIPVAPWLTTWFESNNLIVIAGPSETLGDVPDPTCNKTLAELHRDVVAAVLDTTDGKQPNVTTHATFKTAHNERKDLHGFEPAGLFFMRLADDDGPECESAGNGGRARWSAC